MTAITSNAELETLRLLETRAQELREFLETLPSHLKWERFDELRERCARLLENVPRPAADERLKVAWARTHERLAELHAALSARLPRARVMARYDELSREYEQWLSAFRARARAMGMTSAAGVSSVKPLIRARTLFHILMGVGAVGLYQFLITRGQALAILFSLFAVVLGLEVTRRIFSGWNHILLTSPIFHPIARPREYHTINSSTWYLTALCIIAPLFSRPAVCVGVLILACADPAAAWIGKKYGTTKLYRRKSIVGSLTFLLVAFGVGFAFLAIFNPEYSILCRVGAAGVAAIAGTVAELFTPERIDDNFTVPIAGTLAAALLV